MNALIDSEQNKPPYSENISFMYKTILKIGEVKNYASMSSSLSFNQSNSPAVVPYMKGYHLSDIHTLITPEPLRFHGRSLLSQNPYLLFRAINRSLCRSCFETRNEDSIKIN